jgi:hypothetical protein
MHENTKNHHTVPFWLKFIHTLIAVFFMACIAYVLYCGITGVQNIWLWLAIGALALEIAVFMLNGQRCPMTNYAERYAPTRSRWFCGRYALTALGGDESRQAHHATPRIGLGVGVLAVGRGVGMA